MRVRLIYWKAAEAEPLIELLRAAGHTVDYNQDAVSSLRGGKKAPPDAFVMDLSRLPAHGREMAIAFRGAKTTRGIPLIFVDGAAEKIAAIRAKLPDAVYTTRAKLPPALKRALANGPANPVVPRQMMGSYGTRTAAQKIGIEENMRVAVIDPPPRYAAVIGELPAGVEFVEDEADAEPCPVTLWFVRDPDLYASGLREMRTRAASTKLWVVWPKASAKESGGVTQNVVRSTANEFGLVDYKICSVNEKWSAMCFARRKAKA